MAGSLPELIREAVGGRTVTRVNGSLSSVGAAATRLWPQDGDRLAGLVVNLSPNTVFVGPFNTVAATRGIRLNPSGGLLHVLWSEDYDLVAWEWFIIADAAASDLLVLEWLLSP